MSPSFSDRLTPELERLTARVDEKWNALRTETAERIRALVADHFG